MTETVLVSGGSGGIGAAVSRQLAARGFHVAVGYASNAENAENLAAELDGTALSLNLTSNTDIHAAIDKLADGARPLAGVVVAASPPPAIAPIFKLPDSELELQWAVNVTGVRTLLDGAIRRLMRPNKRGWVLAVLSEAMGNDGPAAKSMGGYIIAKYGLLGLMKVLEAEYAWLKVHTVSPGYTETDMLGAFDSRFLEILRASEPKGRFATADEVADIILSKITGG